VVRKEETMLARWLLAALHLLAFAFALSSVLARARALRRLGPSHSMHDSATALRDVFRADTVWGITAIVLLVTGAMRAFGGFEKGGAYYLHEPLFHLKMTALVLILLIEVSPMLALIRWRVTAQQGGPVDVTRARRYASMSDLEAGLVIVMMIAASGMARGILAS
jgi:putative membrane protein